MKPEALESRVLFAFTPAQPPIPPVVDPARNTYVLGTDGLRMAVARYKPGGALDTGWAIDGIHTMSRFTRDDVQDVPKAITIGRYGHLFVAGSSGGQWAVGRVNIDSAGYNHAWQGHYLTGTVTALWLDRSEDETRLGVAGTNADGDVQVAVLYAFDSDDPGNSHPGGSLDTSFGGGTGFATAPDSVFKLPAGSFVSASAWGLVERDDLPFVPAGAGENEWLVGATVTYSPSQGGQDRSRALAVVDFRPDGSSTARLDRGGSKAMVDLFDGRAIAAGVEGVQAPARPLVRRSYVRDLVATA